MKVPAAMSHILVPVPDFLIMSDYSLTSSLGSTNSDMLVEGLWRPP